VIRHSLLSKAHGCLAGLALGDALGCPTEFMTPEQIVAEYGWDGDPDWPRFLSLIEDCRRRRFELSFHAPYRRPHSITGFAGGRHEEVQAGYAPMLDIAARFAPAPVVIHGA